MDPVLKELNMFELSNLANVSQPMNNIVFDHLVNKVPPVRRRNLTEGNFELKTVLDKCEGRKVLHVLSDENDLFVICCTSEGSSSSSNNKLQLFNYNCSNYAQKHHSVEFEADLNAVFVLQYGHLWMLYDRKIYAMRRINLCGGFYLILDLTTHSKWSAVKEESLGGPIQMVVWYKYLVVLVDKKLISLWLSKIEVDLELDVEFMLDLPAGDSNDKLLSLNPLLAAVREGYYMLGRFKGMFGSNITDDDARLTIDLFEFDSCRKILKTMRLNYWRATDSINVLPLIDDIYHTFFCTKTTKIQSTVSIEVIDFTRGIQHVIEHNRRFAVEPIRLASNKLCHMLETVCLPGPKCTVDLRNMKLKPIEWSFSDPIFCRGASSEQELEQLTDWKTSPDKQHWLDQERFFFLDWKGDLKVAEFWKDVSSSKKPRIQKVTSTTIFKLEFVLEHLAVLDYLNLRDLRNVALVNRQCSRLVARQLKYHTWMRLQKNFMEGYFVPTCVNTCTAASGRQKRPCPIEVLTDDKEVFVICESETKKATEWKVHVYNSSTYEEKFSTLLVKDDTKNVHLVKQSFVLTPDFLFVQRKKYLTIWRRCKNDVGGTCNLTKDAEESLENEENQVFRFANHGGLVVYGSNIIVLTGGDGCLVMQSLSDSEQSGIKLDEKWRWETFTPHGHSVELVSQGPLIAAIEEGFYMCGPIDLVESRAVARKKTKKQLTARPNLTIELHSYEDGRTILKQMAVAKFKAGTGNMVLPVFGSSQHRFVCLFVDHDHNRFSFGGMAKVVNFTSGEQHLINEKQWLRALWLTVQDYKVATSVAGHCFNGTGIVPISIQGVCVHVSKTMLVMQLWAVGQYGHAYSFLQQNGICKNRERICCSAQNEIKAWSQRFTSKQVWWDCDRFFFVDWRGYLMVGDFLPMANIFNEKVQAPRRREAQEALENMAIMIDDGEMDDEDVVEFD